MNKSISRLDIDFKRDVNKNFYFFLALRNVVCKIAHA